jgi:LPS-assembly lipoprotein
MEWNAMRKLLSTTLLALAAMLALNACGFKLRGTGPQDPLPFSTIFLGFGETSPVGVQLRRNLNAMGNVRVVPTREEADAILEVIREGREKQILSLNSQGRVREYNLLYRLNFRVVDKQGRQLLAPNEVLIRRVQSYNEAQALAKEVEEAQMYQEMQTDLVQQVLRRISAIKPLAPAPAPGE